MRYLWLLVVWPLLFAGTIVSNRVWQNQAVDNGCPSGTYSFYWSGDLASGELYCCYNDGASVLNGANDGTDRVDDYIGSDGDQELYITANDQYIGWTFTTEALFDDDPGTLWCSVYSAEMSAEMAIAESYAYPDAKLVWMLTSGGAGTDYVKLRYRGEGQGNNDVTGTQGAAANQWNRIGWTWRIDAGDDMCVYFSSWECTDNDIIDWSDSYQPNDLRLGESETGIGDGGSFYVDDCFFVHSWQAADPCSDCKGQ